MWLWMGVGSCSLSQCLGRDEYVCTLEVRKGGNGGLFTVDLLVRAMVFYTYVTELIGVFLHWTSAYFGGDGEKAFFWWNSEDRWSRLGQ